MKDEKSILYKKDYVPSHKTDIRKTFAKLAKAAKQVQPVKETQSNNIVEYKKFKG
jgi:hypothetical protein